MKMQKSTIATAVALAIGLGMAGQASASIYARSALDIDELNIDILDSDSSVIPESQIVNNFNFSLTNTASLNGANDIQANTCSGTPLSNNCGAGSPRLDADPANAPGSDVTRTNNNFSFFGPGTDQYSNSDSVINTAELTGDATTNTQQIAESELQGGDSAAASAEIQSTTGFTFQFTVPEDGGSLDLSFLATPNMLAAINDPTAATAAAQANMTTQFRLRKDDGSASAQWSPDGAAGGCFVTGGLSCTETDDDSNLNGNVGVTTHPNSDAFAPGQGLFGIMVAGLTNGDWTLVLQAQTSTLTTRTAGVPEPGIIALFGAGLLGLGAARRRSKRS